jgi:signal transduction histidine kinase
LDIVQPEATQKNITIVLDRSSDPLTMQGNGQLLKIAIMHIIRNAIEAGAAGDTVHVSTDLTSRGVVLKVQDDGPGIPQKLLQNIYEPFYATEDGETGLGIPYVKQIVAEHQGSILITSSERVGTTVEIDLPIHLGMDQEDMSDYQI